MVRVGDWITIPSLSVDGDVQEISINTVKVRNFDKTIVTIPTNSLMQKGVQNWRGMTEAGGRRIKRSINIDIKSIKFCDTKLLNNIKALRILTTKIEQREQDITKYNKEIYTKNTLQAERRFTNIGLFRYYIEQYLKSLPTLNMSLTFLVRQLQPTEVGIPLQIYVFTNDTNWKRYEEIQADIFDHIFASARQFELEIFQFDSMVTKN